MGHFYTTCLMLGMVIMRLVIWLEIFLKLCWKCIDFWGGNLLEATPAQIKILGIIG